MDEEKLLREATVLIREGANTAARMPAMDKHEPYVNGLAARMIAQQVIDLVRQSDRDTDDAIARKRSDEMFGAVREVRSPIPLAGGSGSLAGAEIGANTPSPRMDLAALPARALQAQARRLTSVGTRVIPADDVGHPTDCAIPGTMRVGDEPIEDYLARRTGAYAEGTMPGYGKVIQRTPEHLTIEPSIYGGVKIIGTDLVWGHHFVRTITFEDCTKATILFKDGGMKWVTLEDGQVRIEDVTKPEANPCAELPAPTLSPLRGWPAKIVLQLVRNIAVYPSAMQGMLLLQLRENDTRLGYVAHCPLGYWAATNQDNEDVGPSRDTMDAAMRDLLAHAGLDQNWADLVQQVAPEKDA